MIFEADFISPLMEWRSWIVSFDDDVGLLGLVWLRQWWRRLLCKRFSLLLSLSLSLPLSVTVSCTLGWASPGRFSAPKSNVKLEYDSLNSDDSYMISFLSCKAHDPHCLNKIIRIA